MASVEEVYKDLERVSEYNPLIPRPAEMKKRQEENPIPGLAGMAVPFEFFYAIGAFQQGDILGGSWSMMIFFITAMVAFYIPAQMRLKEMSRVGTPTKETVYLGKYKWVEYYWTVKVIPALLVMKGKTKKTEHPPLMELVRAPSAEDLADYGQSIDDRQIEDLVQKTREQNDESSGLNIYKEIWEQFKKQRRRLTVMFIIAGIVYLFWPKIRFYWFFALNWIGW